MDDAEMRQIMASSQQQAEWSVMDRARFAQLGLDGGDTYEQVAQALGRSSVSYVSYLCRFLDYPSLVQEMLHRGDLGYSQGRFMLELTKANLPDDEIVAFAQEVVEQSYSGKRVQERVKGIIGDWGDKQTPIILYCTQCLEPTETNLFVARQISGLIYCAPCNQSYRGAFWADEAYAKAERARRDALTVAQNAGATVVYDDDVPKISEEWMDTSAYCGECDQNVNRIRWVTDESGLQRVQCEACAAKELTSPSQNDVPPPPEPDIPQPEIAPVTANSADVGDDRPHVEQPVQTAQPTNGAVAHLESGRPEGQTPAVVIAEPPPAVQDEGHRTTWGEMFGAIRKLSPDKWGKVLTFVRGLDG